MTAKELISKHLNDHPEAELCDLIKFCIHAAYGAAHLNADKETVQKSIENEFCLFEADETVPAVLNMRDYCRLELKNPVVRSIGAEKIASLFCLSAAEDADTALEPSRFEFFSELLEESEKCLLNISEEESAMMAEVFDAYKSGLWVGRSHSPAFKDAYKPSYRVISSKYSKLFPIIYEVCRLSENKDSVIIAIDGPCASGKTTASSILSKILDADIISLDDFFLPFHKKTKERLSKAGGNVDSERFSEEILPNLNHSSPFTYKAYSCSNGEFYEKKITKRKVTIIEGVYSMLPEFKNYYDLRIWIDVPKETQKKRLRKRSPELYDRFINEWIPMENKYFSAFKVKEDCHIIINE